MTTITLDTPTPTGTLEELVDRLLAALFPPSPEPAPSLAKTVHEARRLRQTGDPDGALAALAGVHTANVAEAQLRWLYAEWLDIARHRQGGGAGGKGWRRHHAGSRGGHGDALAGGQDGLPAQPARAEAPGRRCVMVVAHTTVDIPALKARHRLGDTVEASGVRLRGRGGSGRASAPSTRKRRAAVRRVTRHRIPDSVGKNSEEIFGPTDLP